MPGGERIRRVAVIAVHGVADQQPCESAEALGAMLLTVEDSKTPELSAYEPFQSRIIHVPLEPAGSGSAAPAGGSRPGTPTNAADTDDPGLTFMRRLLGRYHGVGKRSYLTNRLEGRRRSHSSAGSPSDGCEVDVYEMYWADLSRLGNDPLRVFGSIYHLLLHLSELGMLALNGGEKEFGRLKKWRALVRVQRSAVWLLTILIPILILLILFTMAAAVLVRFVGGSVSDTGLDVEAFSNNTALQISAVVGVTVIFVAVTYFLAAKWLPPNARSWWLVPVLAVIGGAAVGRAAVALSGHADLWLAVELWLVGGALFFFVLLPKYNSVIPGARVAGVSLFAIASFLFLLALVVAYRRDTYVPREVEWASLWTVQMLNIVLTLGWVFLILAAVTARDLGYGIVRSLKGPARARARAAARTSRFTLGISASGMLGIATILFSGFLAWGITSVAAFDCMETRIFPPLDRYDWMLTHPATLEKWLGKFTDVGTCPGVPFPVRGYLRGAVLMGTTTGFPLGLFLVLLCILLLAWMALPSVRFESDSPSKSTNGQSHRAGEWLSHGLDATRYVAHLWWLSVFLILIVFASGDFALRNGWLTELPFLAKLFQLSERVSFPLLNRTGALIAASAALIVFVVVKMGGSALDVVLDVDNYLREEPLDASPRARIAERYVSLLRYIGNKRNAETGRRAYDSVIIVAHSLGALITCDLLRYLRSEARAGRGDPALAALGFYKADEGDKSATIPIHLFTMGNPLRQLLNRFFPHHYQWVRSSPDMTQDDSTTERRDESGNTTPLPDDLSVESWTNAYRSGDYVGRALWADDWYRRTDSGDDKGSYPEPITLQKNGKVTEMCIGLGAHTHYWDQSAPDITDRLDEMILAVCSKAEARA